MPSLKYKNTTSGAFTIPSLKVRIGNKFYPLTFDPGETKDLAELGFNELKLRDDHQFQCFVKQGLELVEDIPTIQVSFLKESAESENPIQGEKSVIIEPPSKTDEILGELKAAKAAEKPNHRKQRRGLK